MISKFEIYGLHRRMNVALAFDGPINIFVSENGRGKTTILNALHSVLKQDLAKLRKLDFESISISFASGQNEVLEISKELFEYKWSSRAYDYLKNKMSEKDFALIIKMVIDGRHRRDIIDRLNAAGSKVNSIALKDLMEEKDEVEKTTKLDDIFSRISEAFSSEILYLPTYRRVEESLAALGFNEKEFEKLGEESSINFGLDDVSRRIKSIREEILQLSTESFNSVSGDLLTKMINDSNVDRDAVDAVKSNIELVPLILSRVGRTLSSNDQSKIINLITSGEVFKKTDGNLVYFLARLINAYKKQEELDKSLQRYVKVCSDYFTNKLVIYDENKIQVDFYSMDSGELLDINKLSSGEKQIASLFSRIYLHGNKPLAILFDEPELSLSVEWQERLLSDIVDSERCRFLMAMTHSPFIFKGMSKYTSDLSRYITKLPATSL